MGQAAMGDREVRPMGIVAPFPETKAFPAQRLTKQECDSVLTVMIGKGLDTYVSINNGSKYVCVFDHKDEPYYIGREDGVCYLFDHNEMVITSSEHFEVVQIILEAILTESENETVTR